MGMMSVVGLGVVLESYSAWDTIIRVEGWTQEWRDSETAAEISVRICSHCIRVRVADAIKRRSVRHIHEDVRYPPKFKWFVSQ